MARQEFLHGGRAGFPARRIWLRGEELFIKSLSGVHRKDRDVVHPRAPFPTAGRKKSQCHAAHRGGRVCLKGHTAGKSEAADQRNAAGRKHRSLRQRGRIAVALKPTGYTESLGMIATEAGVI